MRSLLLLLLAPLLIVALAGCTGDGVPRGTVKDATAVPSNAPAAVGSGDISVTIRVTFESKDGPPAVGAPVLIYYIADYIRPPGVPQLRQQNATWVARTDANGEVTAHLTKGLYYSFRSTVEGHTDETRHYVKIEEKHRTEPITIGLYKSRIEWVHKGSLPLSTYASSTPLVRVNTAPIYFPVHANFSDDAAVQAGYLFRFYGAEAIIRWDNAPPEYADLGVRVMLTPEVFWESYDVQQLPGAMGNSETRVIAPAEMRYAVERPNGVLTVGAITRYPIFTVDGLEYTLTLNADFTTDFPLPRKFPTPYYAAPGAELGAILALAGAALGLSVLRRGR